ncbi:PIG-L family deacetylase, partial [Candidatus Bathyarchaeota archaeon]|nr:PIG-L family deacetylase [Candidatus Bathyarchaeota archaeon]
GGSLLLAHKLQYDIYLYILTHGEAGGSDGENREKEAIASSQMIGTHKMLFGEFEDTNLLPNGDLVNSIERIVKRTSPDLVFSHSIKDEHHDHRAVGLASIEAARYVPNVLMYENPLTKDFAPQLFIDISDRIEEKIKLLSFFESQKDKEYLKSNAIYGLAQYRAFQSRIPGVKFAEAFQVVKLKLFDLQRPLI